MSKLSIVICFFFFILFTLPSCSEINKSFVGLSNQQSFQETSTIAVSDNAINDAGLEDEMFSRFYNTSGTQADILFKQLISALENKDASLLRELFSVSTIRSVENIEVEINALINFFEGTLVSHERFGPGTHSSKEGNSYKQDIEASFDVTTTSGAYRMAINFCTIDSTNPENIGVFAIYIIKAENSDMSYAYWGDKKWKPGITIQGE